MFNITLENEIQRGNVKLIQDGSNLKMTIEEDKYSLRDDIVYINNFCKRLKDFEYNNVLILGLGLGIIPYYIENNTEVIDIDVVEINKNVVDVTSSLNHLKHTNIINEDLHTYITDKKYDLIIVDIWWNLPRKYKTDIMIISNRYCKFIKENGKIYFPLCDKIF